MELWACGTKITEHHVIRSLPAMITLEHVAESGSVFTHRCDGKLLGCTELTPDGVKTSRHGERTKFVLLKSAQIGVDTIIEYAPYATAKIGEIDSFDTSISTDRPATVTLECSDAWLEV